MPSSNPLPLENFETLANGMAHAIRNPLSSILTASTLVADDPNITEETRMLLEVIVRESRHLNRIFTDFLEYVRPVELAPAKLQLAPLVRRVVGHLQRDGILGEAQVDVDDAITIWADDDSIDGALRQILLNAGEAMKHKHRDGTAALNAEPAAGKITVIGSTSDDRVTLVIEDEGPGFTPRQLERGFDPFFSDTADGTGLGLPLACAAIFAAEGTIELRNRTDGTGAQVVISFPTSKD